MDDQEFRRVLDLFPVVRSRNYHPDSDSSKGGNNELTQWQDAWEESEKQDTGSQIIDDKGPFWEKLKLAAEKKIGAAEAENFCKSFRRLYKKLVYEELSLDAARKFINYNESLE